jgi:hypothetical protein
VRVVDRARHMSSARLSGDCHDLSYLERPSRFKALDR